MIRPITMICWILALSAGLYLYRAKHEVELIDQHIDQIAKQTADLRIESRGLLDEWIRLGEPGRLHKYSDEYLGLQPITPSQFARLSDLPSRLPATQPDPPDAQADVVAQSSGGLSPEPSAPGLIVPDGQSSGAPGGVQPAAVEPAAEDLNPENAMGSDGLPIPPIPPAVAPSISERRATPLPLQAKPVSPRPSDGGTDPETTRVTAAAPGYVVDEPRTAAPRVLPATQSEPRQGTPAAGNGPVHGLPPLQAQAQSQRDVQGLPPLQAQAQAHEPGQGPARLPPSGEGSGRISGQSFGQPPAQPMPRAAEIRGNEPQRENRPIELQPGPRQAIEPRGPEAQIARQTPATGPSPGGSLLGMSRGSVPLPLPAPVPVNANWSGQTGTGSLGQGR